MRHPVPGRKLFQVESMETTGELVDISRGGVCIRSEVRPQLPHAVKENGVLHQQDRHGPVVLME